MRKGGVEPPTLAGQASETCAYANSATSANFESGFNVRRSANALWRAAASARSLILRGLGSFRQFLDP